MAVVNWDGGAGTFNWNDANNWDNNTIPGLSDDAVIGDLTGTPTITVNATTAVQSVTASEKVAFASGATFTTSQLSTYNAGVALAGGTFSPSFGADIYASSTWSAGNIVGSGNGAISLHGDMTFSGATNRSAQNTTIFNYGTFTQVSGQLDLNNALFGNDNVYLLQGASSQIAIRTFGTGEFSNNSSGSALFADTMTGTHGVSGKFSNHGSASLTVGSGTFQFPGGSAHAGAFSVALGATLQFQGTTDFNSGATFAGAGTVQFSSGTYNVNADLTVPKLINNAVISVASGKTLTAPSATLTGGTLTGAGTVEVSGTTSVTLTTTISGNLVNTGTLNLVGTNLQLLLNSPGVFTNANGATLVINSTANPGITGGGQLNNSGLITTTGTAGIAVNNYNILSGGEIRALSGTLALPASGSHAGTFNAQPGATINVTNGTMTLNAGTAFTGGGNLVLGNGTYNVQGAATLATPIQISGGTVTFAESNTVTSALTLSSGTLNVAANKTLTLNATGNVLSGTLSGAGTVRNAGTATVGGSALSVSGAFANAGTITHSGISSLTVTGTFTNELGAMYLVTANTGGLNVSGGAAAGIVNFGTIRRSAGTGVFNFNASLVGTPTISNQGIVEIQTGTATWVGANNATHTGSFDLSIGTTLTFSNGIQTFASGSQIIGAGAAIFNGGTMNFTGAVTITTPVQISGGALTFSENTPLNSTVIMSSGTINVAAEKTVTLNASGNSLAGTIGGLGTVRNVGTASVGTVALSVSGGLANAGTIMHSGTSNVIVTGSFVNEAGGTYLITANTGGLNVSGGVASGIVNLGTIQRSAGTGEFNFNASVASTPTISNQGIVEIQTGTATWVGASNATHTGSFDLSNGTTLSFSNGTQTFATGSQIIGAGTAIFNGGTMNFTGVTLITAPVQISGGTVTFSESNTISAGLTLSSGSLNVTTGKTITLDGPASAWNAGGLLGGAGSVIVGSGRTMTINPNGAALILQAILNNQGTINVTTAGALSMSGAGAISNSGLFDIQSPAATLTNTGSFTNTSAGTLRKSNNAGVVTLGPTHNSGTIDVQAGTLSFNQGGVWTGGTYTVAAGAILQTSLSGGSWNWSGMMSGSGAGAMRHAGGNISVGSGGVTFDFAPGLFTFNSSAVLSGNTITIPVSKGITLNPNGAVLTFNTSVSNAGTIAVNMPAGGRIDFGTLGSLSNSGLFELQNGTGTVLAGAGTITNTGIFLKSTSSGAAIVSSPLNNNGTLNVTAGTLTLSGAGTHAGFFGGTSSLILAGTSHTLSGEVTIANMLVNAGTVNIDGIYNVASSTTLTGGTLNMNAGTNVTSLGSSLTVDGGTLNLNSGEAQSIANFTQTAGTFSSGDALTITGANSVWSGGTISGSGSLIVASGATLALTTPANTKNLLRTLTNQGTVRWTGGPVSGTASIVNQAGANFNAQITQSAAFYPPIVNQAGATFTRTGAQTAIMNGALTNAGTVTVTSAVVALAGGATHSGTFNGANGKLEFLGGSHTLTGTSSLTTSEVAFNAGSITVNGIYNVPTSTSLSGASSVTFNPSATLTSLGSTLSFTNGTATFNSGESISVATLSLQGGTLTGSDQLTVTSSANWSSGTMSGSGATTLAAGASGSLIGTGSKSLTTRTFVNAGTITQTGTGSLNLTTATLTIAIGGTYDLQSDSGLGGSGILNVVGLLKKSAGTGTSSLAPALNNTGRVQADSGTLTVSGAVIQGSSTTLSGGQWIANNATLNLPAGSDITTIGAAAGITLSGTLSSINRVGAQLSSIEGSFTLASGRVFSTASHLANSGTVSIGAGSSLSTTGTYTQSAGSTLIDGTLNSTTTNSVVITGGTLSGSGTIDDHVTTSGVVAPGNSPGIITINGDYTQSLGGSLNIELSGNSAVIPEFDQLVVNGVVTLNGALNVSYLNGFTPSTGSTFRIIDNDGADAVAGNFTGLLQNEKFVVGAKQFQINYQGGDGNDVVLTALASLIVTSADDSGAGSLRQAILDANAGVGLDTILFNIAGTGVHTISPATELPTITEAVVIDGYSQPGASANTLTIGNNAAIQIELNGSSAGVDANGLSITASASTVQGLAINRFLGSGIAMSGAGATGNIIRGNFLGTNAAGTVGLSGSATGVSIEAGATNNLVGGSTRDATNLISGNSFGVLVAGNNTSGHVIAGNTIGLNAAGTSAIANAVGVRIDSASSNRVGTDADGNNDALERNIISGNGLAISLVNSAAINVIAGNYVGLGADGSTAFASTQPGIFIFDSSNNTIGGTSSGAGNVISGMGDNSNGWAGLDVRGTGNQVLGNLIGTDATGMLARGNGLAGVMVTGTNNVIGGLTASARNVISGNLGYGVIIPSSSSGNLVNGNYIGTAIDGTTPLGNGLDGVWVYGNSNTIGGVAVGAGNVIAFSGGDGVRISSSGTGNSVRGNAIGFNTQLGIDLVGVNGVNANDQGDVDIGANNLQNYPILTGAYPGASARVIGTLNGAANSTFALDFYANTTADPTAHGEGQRFLGSTTVATNGSGNASFDVSLPDASIASREIITATATDANGNTSEFALNQLGNAPPDVTIQGAPATISEGSTIVLTSTVADSDMGETFTYSWSVTKNGVSFGAPTSDPSFTLNAFDDGSYVVTLTVSDSLGATGTDSKSISVTNAAPTNIVMNVSPTLISEGSSTTLVGTLMDASLNDSHTITVVWGDNTPNTTLAVPAPLLAEPVTVLPASDRGGEDTNLDGIFETLLPDPEPQERIRIRFDGTADRRGAFEFPLSTIPLGAQITSATVTFGIVGVGGAAVNYEIYGYAADGTVTLADMNAGTLLAMVTRGNTNPQNIVVSLEPLLQSLVNSGTTHVGLMVRSVSPGAGEIYLASAAGSAAPILSVQYAVRSFAATHVFADNPSGNAPYTISATVTDDDGGAVASGPQLALDQFYDATPVDIGGGPYWTLEQAQTFTVGESGKLEAIELYMNHQPSTTSNLIVEIRPTVNGIPLEGNNTSLASAILTPDQVPLAAGTYTRVELGGANLQVTQGQVLAIVLRITDTTDTGYNWMGKQTGTYAGGSRYIRNITNGPAWLAQPAIDSGFKTFIQQTAAPNPTLTVSNVTPSVNAGPDISRSSMGAVIVTGSFSDPGADTWTGTVNYGDGSGDQALVLSANKSFTLNHTYASPGSYAINVRVRDDDNAVGTDTMLVTLNPFAVDTTADTVADDGLLSLREAIQNANSHAGVDTIKFNIAGSGVQTIQLLSALPAITDPVIIDGYTQPGSSPNTLMVGSNAALKIELSGASAGVGVDGLTISAANSTVKGLIIKQFGGSGIVITGAAATGNLIQGNMIGSEVDATIVSAASNNAGVSITNASGNTIGGSEPAARNIIVGNIYGIKIQGAQATGNLVAANYIGTDASGTIDRGNNIAGIAILSGAHTNSIGGPTDSYRNLISGNNQQGIWIQNVSNSNVVQGNYIGSNITGTAALANATGILISGAPNTTIGGFSSGSSLGAGNLISGNAGNAILVSGSAATVIRGNMIGTNAAGNAALANALNGIRIDNAAGTIIGGDDDDDGLSDGITRARNVISGNALAGVQVAGTGNAILGNYIGTSASGALAIGNGTGVIVAASSNTIGSASAGGRNVISGNASQGINITGAGASGNSIIGNYIGTDASGTTDLGNSGGGVSISTANNTVGGETATPGGVAGNIISGNVGSGVRLSGAGAINNTILGNIIGTNANDTAVLSNSTYGVEVSAGAANNTIGGATAGSRNVISENLYGIALLTAGTGNVIAGNYIGTNNAGTAALRNVNDGVFISNTPGTLIGGANRNVISGNLGSGIALTGASTIGSTIVGNFIGLNSAGTGSVANATGITISGGATGTTIGGVTAIPGAGVGNVISGNTASGISIVGAGSDNKIQGNLIGTNATGSAAIGNASTTTTSAAGVLVSAMNGAAVLIGTDGDGSNDADEGNVISGNFRFGIRLQGGNNDSGSHVVAGNMIGVDLTGTVAISNQAGGISILTSRNNRIGTNADGISDALEANVIAGNRNLGGNPAGVAAANGILISDSILNDALFASQNMIAGNLIGTDISGSLNLGNQASGVSLTDARDNTLGGVAPATSNIIAFNGTGLSVTGQSTGNLIRRNSLYNNLGLGIDLGNSGVTANDAGDQDTGANGLQNYPVLTAAVSGAQTRVVGQLDSAPNALFEIDFYASSVADPSGYGEGKRYLGTISVSTNSSGIATFDQSVPGVSIDGDFITALAIDSTSNTSEFSAAAISSHGDAPTVDSTNLILTAVSLEGGFGVPSLEFTEGTLVRLDGLFTNLDATDAHTVQVDWGDGSPITTLTIAPGPRGFSAEHSYTDDRPTGTSQDSYTIEIFVSDDDNSSGQAAIDVTIVNAIAMLDPVTALSSPQAFEGETLTLSGMFTDDGEDLHRLGIDWGDGSPTQTVQLPLGARTFTIPHHFINESTQVAITILDDDTVAPQTPHTLLLLADIRNAAPAPTFAAPQFSSEGLPLTLLASGNDPGLNDNVTFHWVVSRDGIPIFESDSPTLNYMPRNEGVYTFDLTATDRSGASASFTQTTNVTNVAPRIDSGSLRISAVDGTVMTSIPEGKLFELHGSYLEPGLDDAISISINWGDGSANSSYSLPAGNRDFTATHIYLDDGLSGASTHQYAVLVEIKDGLAGTSANSLVTVSNTAPRIAIMDNGSDDFTIRLLADVQDDSPLDTITYQWNVVGVALPSTTSLNQKSLEFPRTASGFAQVDLAVADDDLGFSTATTIIVLGTASSDTITIAPSSTPGNITIGVATNTSTSTADFAPTGTVIIAAQGSDDTIRVDASLAIATFIDAGSGNDTVQGGLGSDTIVGGAGDDLIHAGEGNNVIDITEGNDTSISGSGDDVLLVFGFSDKEIDDLGGTDTLDFSRVYSSTLADEGVTLDLTLDAGQTQSVRSDGTVALSGTFENVVGSEFNDKFTGNGADNYIAGLGGDDLLFAGDGSADTLDGGTGNDSIIGSDGNDLIFGGEGQDTLEAGSGQQSIMGGDGNDLIFGGEGGSDSIDGGAGDDSIAAGDGNGLISGGEGNDTIAGGGGQQSISGGDGNDLIFGGYGSDETIQGGSGDDSIIGSTGNDSISGGDGNDTIESGSGDQAISGGDGNDLIFGGEGGDSTILGGAGDDSILGSDGNDLIGGGDGNDTISGGTGVQSIDGGSGNDLIFGSDGSNDLLVGGLGDDSILGSSGNDIVFGGSGNDTISSGSGDQSLSGGDGNDLIFGGGSGDITLDGGSGDDSITGSDGNDLIFGGDGNDTITSGSGDQSLSGGDGNDLIFGGGSGDITLDGGNGDDSIVGSEGNDLIFGGDGNDTITSGSGDQSLSGGNGSDLIVGGGSGDVTLDGGSGDDSIVGSEGNDLIFGGDGNDTITSGSGDQSLSGGNGNDLIVGGGSGDVTLDGGSGDDSIVGSGGNDLIFGGEGNDTLMAGSGDQSINGGDGNDLIFGGYGGDDTLTGGTGDDSIVGSDGNDLIFGGEGNDTIEAGTGDTSIDGGDGNDLIFGGDGNDTYIAGSGDDSIIGSGGDDLIIGGDGNDTYTAGSGDDSIDGGAGNDLIFGDGLSDAVLTASSFSVAGKMQLRFSDIELAWLRGDNSANIIDASASSLSVMLEGRGGNDTLIGGLGDDVLDGGSGDNLLQGNHGDDFYRFARDASGSNTIDEADSLGEDTLDFLSFTSSLTLDLANPSIQLVGATLWLKLIGSIENAFGSAFNDKLFGNSLDNKLVGAAGEDELDGREGNDTLSAGFTRTVYLDFDSLTETSEHFYTDSQRDQIQQRIEEDYAPFDIQFTRTRPTQIPFITVVFNAASFLPGSPLVLGGISERIGWRELAGQGVVRVDVNGFLGTSANKLPGTDENYIALTSTIAAHELAHMYGLRHSDALGPPGSGLFVGRSLPTRFRPIYSGPTAASETKLHLVASPASVGTTLIDALGNPFFGEREAVKMSFAESGHVVPELLDVHKIAGQIGTLPVLVQPLGELPALSVPNTVITGINAGLTLNVAAIDVTGEIVLTSAGISESDYYTFTGRQDDLLTIEVMSDSLRHRFSNTIDSIVRVYDSSGRKVAYYNNKLGAFNDDLFEPTDSLLIDFILPADGTYTIEVDTFSFSAPEFPEYQPNFDIDAFRAANPTNIFVTDRDTGGYELFIYRMGGVHIPEFTGGDILAGGPGADVLIGNSGRETIFGFNPAEDTLRDPFGESSHTNDLPTLAQIPAQSTTEGSPLSFTAVGSSLDGGPLLYKLEPVPGQTFPIGATIDLQSGLFYFLPVDDGEFATRVVLQTASGATVFQDVLITVANGDPVITSLAAMTGATPDSVNVTVNFTDVGAADTHTATFNWGNGVTQSFPVSTSQSGGSFTANYAYPASGIYTVTVTITDDDGGATSQSTTVSVVVVRVVNGELQIVGTSGDDTIRVYQQSGTYLVYASFLPGLGIQTFNEPINRLYIDGRDGKDSIDVSIWVSEPALILGGGGDDTVSGGSGADSIDAGLGNDTVYGWAGNDTITGADGDDILYGGEGDDLIRGGDGGDKIYGDIGNDILNGDAGNDIIEGGHGGDIMIGGLDADHLLGDQGEDILIGGYTTFDNQNAALLGILSEWSSNRSFATRVKNINGTGSGPRLNGQNFFRADSTVFGDSAADRLEGDANKDWFFASLTDEVEENTPNEVLDQLSQ